jgi:putative membrane protein
MMNYNYNGYGDYGMMYPSEHFDLLGLLWWILIILVIVMIVRSLRHGGHGMGMHMHRHEHQQNHALGILRERYAKGEIGKQEFDEKRRDLE